MNDNFFIPHNEISFLLDMVVLKGVMGTDNSDPELGLSVRGAETRMVNIRHSTLLLPCEPCEIDLSVCITKGTSFACVYTTTDHLIYSRSFPFDYRHKQLLNSQRNIRNRIMMMMSNI